jgi:predicted DNA-binding protein (MmcQ/YjbR family)
MNVDSVREYCLSFDGATEKLQWSDALCFKVNERMFAVLGLDDVRLTFKCMPEAFAELIERENIRPAPYLARHKWVMLDRLDALSTQELKDFVRLSYEMVLVKAPKKRAAKKKKHKSSISRSKRVRPNA